MTERNGGIHRIFYNMEYMEYRKIPKISPGVLYFSKALFEGLIFGGAYIRRGLCTEGNLRYKIGWASFQWKGNLSLLLCFALYSRANSKYKPSPEGLYSEGRRNGGFFALQFWGAYIWRGLFSEFYGTLKRRIRDKSFKKDIHVNSRLQ